MLAKLNYLTWGIGITLVIICLLAFSLFNNQIVIAETDPTAVPTDLGQFIETSENLTFTVNPKDLLANQRLYINDEGKALWDYVGTETDSDLRTYCNSSYNIWLPETSGAEFDIVSSLASRAIEAEAQVVEVETGGLAALLTLELPANATNALQYCFRVPIFEGDQESSQITYIYKFYQLRLAGSATPGRVNFEVIESAPLADTNDSIPSSLILRSFASSDALTDWQYAQIGVEDICGVSNSSIQFTKLELNNDQAAELLLTKEMAGQHLCFRATNTDGKQLYESYRIAQLMDEVNTTGETKAEVDYTWVVIVLIILLVGLVIYFIARSK